MTGRSETEVGGWEREEEEEEGAGEREGEREGCFVTPGHWREEDECKMGREGKYTRKEEGDLRSGGRGVQSSGAKNSKTQSQSQPANPDTLVIYSRAAVDPYC